MFCVVIVVVRTHEFFKTDRDCTANYGRREEVFLMNLWYQDFDPKSTCLLMIFLFKRVCLLLCSIKIHSINNIDEVEVLDRNTNLPYVVQTFLVFALSIEWPPGKSCHNHLSSEWRAIRITVVILTKFHDKEQVMLMQARDACQVCWNCHSVSSSQEEVECAGHTRGSSDSWSSRGWYAQPFRRLSCLFRNYSRITLR